MLQNFKCFSKKNLTHKGKLSSVINFLIELVRFFFKLNSVPSYKKLIICLENFIVPILIVDFKLYYLGEMQAFPLDPLGNEVNKFKDVDLSQYENFEIM